MAKLPLGRSTGGSPGERRSSPEQGTARAPMNLEELTRSATYIVDDAGRKQAIVVEWSAWQNFIRQAGVESTLAASASSGATSSASSPAKAAPARTAPPVAAPASDSEYALRQGRGDDDLFRPKPASGKEAADFTLESPVIRRNT